jgi:hypothetical protein
MRGEDIEHDVGISNSPISVSETSRIGVDG